MYLFKDVEDNEIASPVGEQASYILTRRPHCHTDDRLNSEPDKYDSNKREGNLKVVTKINKEF